MCPITTPCQNLKSVGQPPAPVNSRPQYAQIYFFEDTAPSLPPSVPVLCCLLPKDSHGRDVSGAINKLGFLRDLHGQGATLPSYDAVIGHAHSILTSACFRHHLGPHARQLACLPARVLTFANSPGFGCRPRAGRENTAGSCGVLFLESIYAALSWCVAVRNRYTFQETAGVVTSSFGAFFHGVTVVPLVRKSRTQHNVNKEREECMQLCLWRAPRSHRVTSMPPFCLCRARQDADRMASLWLPSNDVMCIHPGDEPVTGHQAVSRSWRSLFSSGDARFSTSVIKVRPQRWD